MWKAVHAGKHALQLANHMACVVCCRLWQRAAMTQPERAWDGVHALCLRPRLILWDNTVVWGRNCFWIGQAIAIFRFAHQHTLFSFVVAQNPLLELFYISSNNTVRKNFHHLRVRPPCCNSAHAVWAPHCCFERTAALFKYCSSKTKKRKRKKKNGQTDGIWFRAARFDPELLTAKEEDGWAVTTLNLKN